MSMIGYGFVGMEARGRARHITSLLTTDLAIRAERKWQGDDVKRPHVEYISFLKPFSLGVLWCE
jgi:hypothetical protein